MLARCWCWWPRAGLAARSLHGPRPCSIRASLVGLHISATDATDATATAIALLQCGDYACFATHPINQGEQYSRNLSETVAVCRTTSRWAERGEVESMGQRQGADWEKVVKSLTDFDESMGRLLNDDTLLDRYPDKWVGVWHGEVQAAEDDLDSLLNVLEKNGRAAF